MTRIWTVRLTILAAALTLTLAPARADTTDELVAHCGELLKVHGDTKEIVEKQLSHASGVCWGYVDAIFTAFDFQTGNGTAMLGVCKPNEFARGHLINLFLDYVVRHPDARQHHPAYVFYWAAYEKYACTP